LTYGSVDLITNSPGSIPIDGLLVVSDTFDSRDPPNRLYQSFFFDDPRPGPPGGNPKNISSGGWEGSPSP
jgi:hypothetical protein